jgi:hypothetical protein
VGRRSRRRGRDAPAAAAASAAAPSATTTDYADAEGNVLTLRDSLSAGTLRKLARGAGAGSGGPASTRDDVWQRQGELMFERLAVSWTISGLPLTGQKELLGRYRMADSDTRRWVRETVEAHLRERHPELGGP